MTKTYDNDYFLERIEGLSDEQWEDLCGYLDNALDNWLTTNEEELGQCDTCGAFYDVASRDGRCGDCGECSAHCTHKEGE